ncbi:hypothetical protein LTR86_008156 [Recurvomyces mirabilis]|nr:hypothetical protein LTR86_008156 [Recurvomyces mirabilis]
MALPSPTFLGLAAAIVLAAGYVLYQATIPKPIPGIPYLKATANQPFGDLSDFIKFNKRTKEVMQFVTNRAEELNTPVCQLFVKPFRKPWVVVADAREAQDIMARRTREFDRSGQFGDMFGALVPHGMVIQPTNDKWRSQRRLAGDTMAP